MPVTPTPTIVSQPVVELANGFNLNDLRGRATYIVRNPTNGPATGRWFIQNLRGTLQNATYIQQIATDADPTSDSPLYIRTRAPDGVWSTWEETGSGSSGADGVDGVDGIDGTNGADGRGYYAQVFAATDITEDPLTFITFTGLAYRVGDVVKLRRDDANYVLGRVTAYNDATGSMTLDPLLLVGSGTYNNMTLSVAGEQGPEGDPGADGIDGTDGVDGADGRTLLNGAGPPDDALDGDDGDFWIDTSVYEIYGPKTAGAWGTGTALTGGGGGGGGNTIRNGSGAPGGGLGADGDFYIDTTAWTIYGPKTAGAWGSPTNLIGADGIDGTDGADGVDGADGNTVLNGAGAPDDTLDGVDGDFWIDTSTSPYEIYGPKTAGAWGTGVPMGGGGGGGGGATTLVQAADAAGTNSYSSSADITFTGDANAIYSVHMVIRYNVSATGNKICFGFAGANIASIGYFMIHNTNGTDGAQTLYANATDYGFNNTNQASAKATTNNTAIIHGFIEMDGTGGTVDFRFRTIFNTMTLKAGTFLVYQKVN